MSSTTPTNLDQRNVLIHKLQHLEKSLSLVSETMSSLSSHSEDVCHLQQHKEQLSDYCWFPEQPAIIGPCRGDNELLELHTALEKRFFDCSLYIKELLRPHVQVNEPTPGLTHSDSKGVKLPKLDVPTFDGNILNWKCFWEQFCISVHDRTSPSDSEKLVYLQHALIDGSAKHVIEGLSCSGEHYTEAVKCLTLCYDCPSLIHQTHVKMHPHSRRVLERSCGDCTILYSSTFMLWKQ